MYDTYLDYADDLNCDDYPDISDIANLTDGIDVY